MKNKKEKPYETPQWMIPDWERGRITEEQWTPKQKEYDQNTQSAKNTKG